jgi:hypothetical protein
MIRGFAIAALHVSTPYWVLVLRRIGSAACSVLLCCTSSELLLEENESRLCPILSWDLEDVGGLARGSLQAMQSHEAPLELDGRSR